MADWAPELYARFHDERTRPAADLLAQVPLQSPRKIVDVGCGPGNSTELLVARYPDAEIIGIDSSPAMLETARKALPHLRFVQQDATDWAPDRDTDLVFANAVYQWIPDHISSFRRVLRSLPSGAVLAVQMPDNLAEPTHMLMKEVAAAGPWAKRLRDAARDPLPPVRDYYDALRGEAAKLDFWHTVYNHVLASPAAIVEWVRGTGLRPFLDPLGEAERADFLARYTEAIAAAYPAVGDKVLLRFPRLFMVAVR